MTTPDCTPTHDKYGFAVEAGDTPQGPADILTQYGVTEIPEGATEARAMNAKCGLDTFGHPIPGATLSRMAQHLVDTQTPRSDVPPAVVVAVDHGAGEVVVQHADGTSSTLVQPEGWALHEWHSLLHWLHLR